MRSVRVFVSSPGDTHFERMRVERVVERLNGEFSGVAKLEAIRVRAKQTGNGEMLAKIDAVHRQVLDTKDRAQLRTLKESLETIGHYLDAREELDNTFTAAS